MIHPIFGKLTTDKSNDQYESKGRYPFRIDANESKKRELEDTKVKSRTFKCPMCNGDHILPQSIFFRGSRLKDVSS